MRSDRRDLIDGLARSALRRRPAERVAYLEEACAGDEELRREVESLISRNPPTISVNSYDPVAQYNEDQHLEGSVVGHYRIIRKIGAGGMGQVYLAQDTSLQRQVAIKLLWDESLKDERAGKRLIREARAAARLEHPNICAVHEVRKEDSLCFIVMQYVEGETLASKMRREPINLSEGLDIAIQIADALAEAHSHGVIHRDIKPQNVMVTNHGRVKVLDFGLAKTVEQLSFVDSDAKTDSLPTTEEGKIAGTVPYMSPEQVKGEALDSRTDIFSFGVMLYEILSGRHPFAELSDAETIAGILTKVPPPLADYASVPAELERILGKCLEKDKRQRYLSGRELLAALKDLGRNLSISTATLDREAYKPARRFRRAFALSIAVATLVVIGILAFLFARTALQARDFDSVAVLPFINNSNPSTEYLSDGITDNLINTLSRFPNLRVIARNSVLRYKPADAQTVFPDAREVGQTLNVRAVITGTITQVADRLSISVELADTRDNRRIWGALYDRKQSDILTLQEDISRDVSEKLGVVLNAKDRSWLGNHGTENTKAYTLYLNGVHEWNKRNRTGIDKSVEFFKQAINEDPSYAQAFTGLANSYLLVGSFRRTESCDLARGAAISALRIDDTLAEAYSALAFAKMTCDWDWSGAESGFNRSLEINPNDATGHHWYSSYLTATERHDQALVELKRALDLDPLSPVIRTGLGSALYYARRFDESITEFEKAIKIHKDFAPAHVGLGYSYIMTGRGEDAIIQFNRALELSGDPKHRAGLACAYAATGRTDDARKILDELVKESDSRLGLNYYIAQLCVGLNKKQEALNWLEQACEEHHLQIMYIKVRPTFDGIRDDPRFKDLLRKVNLAGD